MQEQRLQEVRVCMGKHYCREREYWLQGTATTSGDVAHDLSKAKALSNALVVMCGELPIANPD